MKANAVFEGGGVRGIGIVGALNYLESVGYEWNCVAGTSVGAIIASMTAAGYSAKEMKKMITEMNFNNFLDRDRIQKVPIVGKFLGLFRENGVYSGEFFEIWLADILKARGITTFKDLKFENSYRLKVVAADVTRKTSIILPDDLPLYGINPDDFSVAAAVRMSISLPFYFKPVTLNHKDGVSYIVDGGICCNFPITIFDILEMSEIPTLGFKFQFEDVSNSSRGKTDPFSFLCDVASTMSGNNQSICTLDENVSRTINIPTVGVEATQFDISREKALELFKSGYTSAHNFMKTWDYQEYLKQYKHKENDITA